MKANELTLIEQAVRDHIKSAITYLHNKANVGDQLLLLGKHEISYSDGAEYTVSALHWDTTAEPGDELRIYQEEEDSDESENYPVTVLETDKLLELLESLEAITGCTYDAPLSV